MRILLAVTLLSVAAARPAPGGLISPWDQPWASPALSSVSLVHQPAVVHAAPAVVHAAPAVVHAAPAVVHAAPALAYAKPAATSYASFQQILNPVSVAQPVVHAHVVAQPLVQAVHAAPVVHAAPLVHAYQGHGW